MIELNRAVLDFLDRIFRGNEGRFLHENLVDTFRGGSRDDDHNDGHRHEVQRHHDLHRIGEEAG